MRKKQEIAGIRRWREDCWERIFSLFREFFLQRLQSRQDESAEEEEMKQQKRINFMKDLTKKIRSKGRMDAKNRWWALREMVQLIGGDEKQGREGKD